MFFFGAAERTSQDTPQDNNITAANAAILGLPAQDVGLLNRYLRDTFAMGKVNRSVNEQHSLQFTYAMTHDTNRDIFSNFATRSRQNRLFSLDQSAQAHWTAITGKGTWFHEIKGEFHHRNYALDFLNEGGPPLVPDGQLKIECAERQHHQRGELWRRPRHQRDVHAIRSGHLRRHDLEEPPRVESRRGRPVPLEVRLPPVQRARFGVLHVPVGG